MPRLDYSYQPYISPFNALIIKNERKKTFNLIKKEIRRFYEKNKSSPEYEGFTKALYREFKRIHKNDSGYKLYNHYLLLSSNNDLIDKEKEYYEICRLFEKIFEYIRKYILSADSYKKEDIKQHQEEYRKKIQNIENILFYPNQSRVENAFIYYGSVFHEERRQSPEENVDNPLMENVYAIKR